MNGIEITNNGKLEGWERIFKRWIFELDKSLDLTNGVEAPYVHAEHGNTHHLGVSAAMEGYATIREVIGNRGDSLARLDLVFVSEKYLDIVECKWREFSILNLPSKSLIEDKVNSACSDAKSYTNKEKLFTETKKKIRRVGVTFFTPHYTEEEAFNEKQASELISFIDNTVTPDILAWSFPDKSREMKYWHRKYPGVIAVVKLAE
ncbi:MAG: hypothetical protein ACR65R_16010 [Methylomicrobium sp.]